MKKGKKFVFFLVFVLIGAFAASTVCGFDYQYGDIITTYIHGLDDIRLGIDIQGGVDVTFTPEDEIDATQEELDAATEVIKFRLAALSINDSEVYSDEKSDRIIVRFPWQAGEEDFDPEAAVKELGDVAVLTFRYGDYTAIDENGLPNGEIILSGEDVTSATVYPDQEKAGQYVVALTMTEKGASAFATATAAQASKKGSIGIWMDDICVSSPSVNETISNGECQISGNMDYDAAKALADKINSGALPFNLTTASFKTISPTMGTGALNAMVLSGIIAFCLIAVYMIVLYRLPGVVSVIALVGQVSGTLAAITGWFGFMNSATLTIPGIAGIILAVGMGVDASIINGERIKEELALGKSLNAALRSGYNRAFTSIFDGNLTVVIVAIILMGAFGVPDSAFAKLLSFLFSHFGATTEGVIYSFGYTLLVGVILNFVFGVVASRLMVMSLSNFKALQNKKLYGGVTND
ncbi:MAG: protein translocase subunit SecD [Ruminococcus sp.]|nr:protein translocase subunit SecD [Ruminococcus sp.]